ncbi:MAG: hypothetical protein LUF77_05860, partial [Oscillospiraceae bacterium]|nr:hypothetical protein [Oscillospiraceae bacterium]MCD7934822.1 hypothetical protein [Oscillospiraceae bacterium]
LCYTPYVKCAVFFDRCYKCPASISALWIFPALRKQVVPADLCGTALKINAGALPKGRTAPVCEKTEPLPQVCCKKWLLSGKFSGKIESAERRSQIFDSDESEVFCHGYA